MPSIDVEAEALPASIPTPAEMIGEWVVAQVLTHHEKAMAHALNEAQVGYYLPLADVMGRDAAGKRRRKSIPLFPGYLFVCCREDGDRFELLSRKSCYGIIRVANQKRLANELTQVFTANRVARLDPHPFAAMGRRCRIVSGPLQGLEGIVIRRNDSDLLVLQVTMLGAGAAVEIAPELLEPV